MAAAIGLRTQLEMVAVCQHSDRRKSRPILRQMRKEEDMTNNPDMHAFVQNPLMSFSSCQVCLGPEDAPGHLTDPDMQPTVTEDAVFDAKVQLVDHSPEPTLREIVRAYYLEHFAAGQADGLTEQYIARLRSQETARSAPLGLEWSEDGYSLRTPFDGDVDGDGRHVVVGGETVVTFADSDEGDKAREAFSAIMTARSADVGREARGAMTGARMRLEGRAQAATDCLAKTDWRPTRAHVEGMRNAMRDAISEINEALAFLTTPPTDDQPHAFVKNLLIPFSSCQVCLAPDSDAIHVAGANEGLGV